MLRDEVLNKLRADKAMLDEYHIARIGVFGSVARGEADDDSDIDIVIDFERGRVPGLIGLAGIHTHLEDLLGRQVDIVTTRTPNERLNRVAAAEAIWATIKEDLPLLKAALVGRGIDETS